MQREMVIEMMDIKEKENRGNEQLLKDAKAKLQWYTMEAADEEFDEEEVDLLVKLIQKLEHQESTDAQQVEKELERFRAYVDFYKEDEAVRNNDKEEKVGRIVEPENVEDIRATGKKVEKKTGKKAGKILRFPSRKVVVAAAVCLVLLIVAGSTLGEVNADENTGFFHWLRKDKEGIVAITSPGKNSVGMEDNVKKEYSSIEELPEEYHQYVIEKDNINLLQEYEFQGYLCEDTPTFRKIKARFVNLDKEKSIYFGLLLYPDTVIVTRDTFENYSYLHTNYVGEKEVDIFVKEEAENLEYIVLFYEDNKKYYVSGNETVEFLESVTEEYMSLVLN